jgi:hypothetical protein
MLENKIKRTTRADFVPESKHIENIALVKLVLTCAISDAGEKQKSKIQKGPVSFSPAGVLHFYTAQFCSQPCTKTKPNTYAC